VSRGFEVQGDLVLIDSLKNGGEDGVQQESQMGHVKSTDGIENEGRMLSRSIALAN